MADASGLVDALVRSRRGDVGSLAAGAALGGLALIAGLGYRALNRSAPAETSAEAPARRPFAAGDVSADEADLYLRAMAAATVADGIVDARERARLDAALAEARLDETGRRAFEDLLRDPPDADEIADRVSDPETAARVYAAARLAVDADTMQERAFLARLAEAMDVPADAVARIEAEAGG
ncbi:DUF533 domain-containing protein [Methylobacterium sp. JK268]